MRSTRSTGIHLRQPFQPFGFDPLFRRGQCFSLGRRFFPLPLSSAASTCPSLAYRLAIFSIFYQLLIQLVLRGLLTEPPRKDRWPPPKLDSRTKKTPITQFIVRWQSSVMDDVWIPLVKSLCRILCFCFHSAEFSDQQESASVKCRIFRSNPTVGRYLCCRSRCHGHQPVNQHLKDLAVFISQKESCVEDEENKTNCVISSSYWSS